MYNFNYNEGLKDLLLEYMISKNFYKFNSNQPFDLNSGVNSQYYVDVKSTLLSVNGRFLIQAALKEYWRNSGFNMLDISYVVSKESGGILVSDMMLHTFSSLQGVILRKEKKEHGIKSKYMGTIRKGANAVLVDDVITSGSSIKDCINFCEEVGLVPSFGLVIVDREELSGVELPISIYSLLTLTNFKKKDK